MAKGKTNAMRILDGLHIAYTTHSYENKDGKIDGISVAEKIGVDKRQVFKTLVVQDGEKEPYVFIIPVQAELDLKKGSKGSASKKSRDGTCKGYPKANRLYKRWMLTDWHEEKISNNS